MMNRNNINTVMSSDSSSNSSSSSNDSGSLVSGEDPLEINYGMSMDDGTHCSDSVYKTSVQDLEDINMTNGVIHPKQGADQLELVYEEQADKYSDGNTEPVEYGDDDIRKPKGSKKLFDFNNLDFNKLRKRKTLLTIFYGISAFIALILIIHFSVSLSKPKSAAATASEANKSQANIKVDSSPVEVEIPGLPSTSDFDQVVDLKDLDSNSTVFPTNEYTELYSGTGTGTFAPSSFWWDEANREDDAFFNETVYPTDQTAAPTAPWWVAPGQAQWWQGQTWAPTVWSSTSTVSPEEEEDQEQEENSKEEDDETEEEEAATKEAAEAAAKEAAEAAAQEAAVTAAAKAAAEAEAAGADKAAVEAAAQEAAAQEAAAAEEEAAEAVASVPIRVERKRDPVAQTAAAPTAAPAAPTAAPVNPWMFGSTYAPTADTESPTWVPTATWEPTTWTTTNAPIPLPSPAPSVAPIVPSPAPSPEPIEDLDLEGEMEFENSVAQARASFQH
jgi:chemotaxis protein histidine kinase CheA